MSKSSDITGLPLILEATTSLKNTDGPKVQTFLRVKSVLERRAGKPVLSYFVVYNFKNKDHETDLKKAGVNVIDARVIWKDEIAREAELIPLKRRKERKQQERLELEERKSDEKQ